MGPVDGGLSACHDVEPYLYRIVDALAASAVGVVMPIYEYACADCGHRFEKLVRINADAPLCEQCGGAEVRKLVSASGFILKGGGWYKDHYGLKSSGGDKASGDSGAKPAAPAPAKSE
jgi:putative FmdB family regulatory protein